MCAVRPFRFGTGSFGADSAEAWREEARKGEALGYDTFLMPDHFGHQLAPVPALMAAAMATTSIRIGTAVFDNDFRQPAMLAKEMAPIDILSEGRLELGIGAGWIKAEYEQAGISFDPPSVRVERMQEPFHVIKGLWGDDPFSYSVHHYTIIEMQGWPKPPQRPRPPIMIGCGAKRMLSFAARQADIIGIIAPATPGGRLDTLSDSEERVCEQVSWVREAAGDRFDRIELPMLFWAVRVTDDRYAGAEDIARTRYRPTTPEQILASPYYLIGSIEGIAERLLEMRERFSVSYITVMPGNGETFAPVVARLNGT